jgi:proteasome lid subunit RPN8/RPN11
MFDRAIIDAIKEHAASSLDREVCGLVTAAGYEPQENRHPEPEMNFEMGREAAERIAAGEVLAVVHSHTERGYDHPSIMDQEQALAMAVPWGLCIIRGGTPSEPFFWGEGVPPQPFLPRDFRWGPEGTDGRGDCFALVRAWYAARRGLVIPDVPRDETWESEMPDAYVLGWQRAGFQRVPITDLQPGDGVLMAINSRRAAPNHAGIYLGDEMILHHLLNRLAERTPIGFLHRSIVACLRPPEVAP